jgi:hypothetical protein
MRDTLDQLLEDREALNKQIAQAVADKYQGKTAIVKIGAREFDKAITGTDGENVILEGMGNRHFSKIRVKP